VSLSAFWVFQRGWALGFRVCPQQRKAVPTFGWRWGHTERQRGVGVLSSCLKSAAATMEFLPWSSNM